MPILTSKRTLIVTPTDRTYLFCYIIRLGVLNGKLIMKHFRKVTNLLVKSLIILSICIVLVLIISFTFLRVDSGFTALDEASDYIEIPDYYSDIWFKGQGFPIKHELLKEGWSDLSGGGKIFILPNVLTKLPYKNLEESRQWVDYINNTFHPSPAWTFNDRRRKGNYRCMAQAASTVSDWHTLLLGNQLPTYKSIFTGQREQGLNFKILDSLFYQRSTQDEDNYGLNRKKLMEDPVSHTPVPYSLWGYAQILSLSTETDPASNLRVQDYNLPITYRYKPSDFHIYSKPITIFRNKAFWEIIFKKEPKLTRNTIDAIHKHGILYAGIKARFSMLNGNLKKTRLGFIPLAFFSGHGVSIVGYIQKDGNTYFVYRETFGFANKETPESGVSYRMFPIYGFNEIYAFSQPLDINVTKLSPTEFNIVVQNAERKNIDLAIEEEIYSDDQNVQISESNDNYIITTKNPTKLTIAKDYFYQENGDFYTVQLQ